LIADVSGLEAGMSETNQSTYAQIAVLATTIANLAHAAANLAGQPSQQAVLSDLRQQHTALNTLLSSLLISSDAITVGDISNSSGIAIGAGAQSTVRTVDTAGGDYAEGAIDKRSGVFVSGGEIHGPVVGTNSGTIETG
jgi:hypothetical protein